MKFRTLPTLALAGVITICAGGICQAQMIQTLDEDQKREAIDGVLQLLLNNYIFEDLAEQMDATVRERLAAGEYDKVEGGAQLAELLTRHLRDVCKDKHLRVLYSAQLRQVPERDPDREPSDAEKAERRAQGAQSNFGFEKVVRLPGNVGYVKFNGFFDPDVGGTEVASAAMNFVADSDAIIIDMRENGGGSPGMVVWVSSYLFGDDPVHLNSLYYRPSDELTEYWTNPDVPGRKSPDTDVYVLTSNYTFSAAEEFCYNLRCLERATLVGETTGGGAHPGGTMPVNEHFSVWVPTGRAINPITGTNWEGVGVKPHVEVPANEALHNAHLLALKKAMEKADDPQMRAALAGSMTKINSELADIELENEEKQGG